MMRFKSLFVGLLLGGAASSWLAAANVQVISSGNASSLEHLVSTELVEALEYLYPEDSFTMREIAAAGVDHTIRLGSLISAPDFVSASERKLLVTDESYVVRVEGKDVSILGHDPQGVAYAVYAILEELGYGFFLSGNSIPPVKGEPFSVAGWGLGNHPTTPVRISFNWHNFLSSCSTWDLVDWKHWIEQSQKVGFNTIMVHAYGNNPMLPYSFEGVEKTMGKLASTRSGRDWAVNHVNDVRRMLGGGLFDRDYFGSEAVAASRRPQSETVPAMMREAFAYAEQRGVDVNVAVDIDMPACLPQELITKLDEKDRFLIDYAGRPRMKVPPAKLWVARPDTDGGYQYYKAQCDALLRSYPQVDTITIWRRGDNSPLLSAKLHEFPETWQSEYRTYTSKHPKAAKMGQSVGMFGIAKIFAAWQRALNEAGREDIKLAMGSWNDKWLPAAVEFLPKHTELVALDSRILRGKGFMNSYERLEGLSDLIGSNRFIPVIWSHHDDGAYIGSPLSFVDDLSDRLKACNAGGFGIIHWMTHPLDPYYTGHSRQTWAATKNEAQTDTCHFVAGRWFGAGNEGLMSQYLDKWLKDMPAFARETDEYFIDHAIGHDLPEVQDGYRERMGILDQADTSVMSKSQRKQHRFFKEYEQFVSDLYTAQAGLEDATKALRDGEIIRARAIVRELDPEAVVAGFASAIEKRGATKGELGLLVSMNTRWVTHFVRIRQQLGLDAIRYNFGETEHELMAQARGQLTFHFDTSGMLWQTFGEEESGAQVVEVAVNEPGRLTKDELELCASGVMSRKPIELYLSPILSFGCSSQTKVFDQFKPETVSAGRYQLSCYFNAQADGTMRLQVLADDQMILSEEVAIAANAPQKWVSLIYLKEDSALRLLITPVTNSAVISAIELR